MWGREQSSDQPDSGYLSAPTAAQSRGQSNSGSSLLRWGRWPCPEHGLPCKLVLRGTTIYTSAELRLSVRSAMTASMAKETMMKRGIWTLILATCCFAACGIDSKVAEPGVVTEDVGVSDSSFNIDAADETDDAAVEPDLVEVVCGEGFEQIDPRRNPDEVEGCTRVVTPVHMPDYRLDDFEVLATLRIAEKRFSIFRPHQVVDYTAFSNLEKVGGDLLIRHAEGMPENLNGFDSLTSVTGPLAIDSNFGLRSLDGLENLERVGGLEINGNEDLEDISAIHGLIVEGDVRFDFNPKLPRAAIDSWVETAEIIGDLTIE